MKPGLIKNYRQIVMQCSLDFFHLSLKINLLGSIFGGLGFGSIETIKNADS